VTEDKPSLQSWFDSLKRELERAYLQHGEPWKQSGFSGPEDRWIKCRRPIVDCIEKSGTFLDIGSANGYLLECLLKWAGEKGVTIVPFGLDLSEQLVRLAKARLPEYSKNFYVGNALIWKSPTRFDYVRTELVYVPEYLQKRFVSNIIDHFLADHGKLLVTEYRPSGNYIDRPWIDKKLEDWGFQIDRRVSGFCDGQEMTRVCVIAKE
jgi:hypothetical protein